MNKYEKTKMLKDLPSKELVLKEEELFNYKGVDRVVTSSELKDELSLTDDSLFCLKTGIPTMDRILEGVECGELVVVTGLSGHGKCLGKGTPIIMFDGSVKNVEDIKNGDLLMGVDSTPRKVSGVISGTDTMYRVNQIKGDSYVVNSEHILSFKKTGKQEIVNIPIKDYINSTNGFKSSLKGWKTGVEFKEKNVTVEPYFLGIWLGDGTSQTTNITTMDKEVVDYLNDFVIRNDLEIRKQETRGSNKSSTYCIHNNWNNHLKDDMKKYNLILNKHIPFDYKTNTREVRLQLLAGLIDSDGYTNTSGYEFVNKNEILANDVAYLSRSLGFQSTVKKIKGKSQNGTIGEYFKVSINGNGSIIPVKIKRKKVKTRMQIKDVLKTGISIENIGVDSYYGFELDGDKLFLLGDFTVTHNTTFLMTLTNNMAELGHKSLWFTLEVTPRQFMKKITMRTDKIPEFFIPKDNSDNSLAWIEARIFESKAKYGSKVVFIDHINMIYSLEQSKGNVSLEIADLVAKIKQIAIKYNQVIFLVAHCKDPINNKEPIERDIRDSGMIVRLADTVMGVWRVRNDSEPDNTTLKELDEDDNQSKVRIWKNRRTGKLGYFFMEHKDHYLTEINKTDKLSQFVKEIKKPLF